jgi:hypothetical protein
MLQEVMACCVVVVVAELCPHMWVLQIDMRMAIRMGHQVHIQNNMETDTNLIGKYLCFYYRRHLCELNCTVANLARVCKC